MKGPGGAKHAVGEVTGPLRNRDCVRSDALPYGRMPYHRFAVGQTVVAPSGVRDALIPPGPYVIVRLLPPVGSEPHYRVKSAADGHERAVLEEQIQPMMARPAPEVEHAAAKPAPVVRQSAVAARLTPAAKGRTAKAVRGRR